MSQASGSARPEVTPSRLRATVVGREGESLRSLLADLGFEVVEPGDAPDFVICYGGDGSLLGADRDFPTVPKLPIRRNGGYLKCPLHEDEAVLRRVLEGRQSIARLPRLTALAGDVKLHSINDVVFHNALPTSAVRYRVRIDGVPYSEEIVGDGLVAATPFGSSAYYRSITNSVFRVGLGLAFNNSTESVNHLVLDPASVVEIVVTRGPALVLADNSPEQATLREGDALTIRFSSQNAEIWELGTLTCRDCKSAGTGRPAGARHV